MYSKITSKTKLTPQKVEKLREEWNQEIAQYNDNHRVVDLFDMYNSPKPPETVNELLDELAKKNIVNVFCYLVVVLQKNKYSTIKKKKFEKFASKQETDFTIQDALEIVSVCLNGKETTLLTIALLLYKGCTFYPILYYCYDYEFPEIEAERERKAQLKEQRKLEKMKVRSATITSEMMAEARTKNIKDTLKYSQYSNYSQNYNIRCILKKPHIINDFCRFFFEIQLQKKWEILPAEQFKKFEKKYCYNHKLEISKIGYEGSDDKEIMLDKPNFISFRPFNDAECNEMIGICRNASHRLINTVAVLFLEGYTLDTLFDFYTSLTSPLVVVSIKESKTIHLTPNIICAELKPLNKSVVRELVGRERYSHRREKLKPKTEKEIKEDWGKEKENIYDKVLVKLFNKKIDYLKSIREIIILVNEGYSDDEICKYYESLSSEND